MVSTTLRFRDGNNPADSVVNSAWKSNEHWQPFFVKSLPQLPQLTPALTPSQLQGLGAYFGSFQNSVMQNTFGTADYFSFMAMSMVAFTVVFTTAFVGMSVVWDKRLGFMNKVLSTPVSRSAIILSKVFAASVRAIFQSAIVTVVAFALGLSTGTNFAWYQHPWNIRNSISD